MNIFSLLAAEDTLVSASKGLFNSAYKTFSTIVNIILPVIAGFLPVLGVILGVKVAVQFAQAEDEEAKKKAKGHLVNIIIGFCVAIVFIAIIAAVLNSNVVADLFGDQIKSKDIV
jgi:Na+/proline symporter